jgi:hypothetical protein
VTGPNFYNARAAEIYHDDFDFTVQEAAAPLDQLASVVAAATARAARIVATVAFSGVLVIPPGGNLPSDFCHPTATSDVRDRQPPETSAVVAMTALMRARADVAGRVFSRSPHPGADDSDPDYDF